MLTPFEREAITEAFTELCIKHNKAIVVDDELFVMAEPGVVVDSIISGVEQALVERTTEPSLDARGVPTAACPNCGESWMQITAVFDEETYDIAAWATEGKCYSCGTMLTVCCPVDKESEVW